MSGARDASLRATPLGVLRALAALRRALVLYPSGHAVIDQSAAELGREVGKVIEEYGRLRVEIVGETAHIDGYPFRVESLANREVIRDVIECGVDCVQIDGGVRASELIETAKLLNQLCEGGLSGEELRRACSERGVRHVTLARLLPIASERSGLEEWPSLPTSVEHEGYAEVLALASGALGSFFDGEAPDAGAVHELLSAIGEYAAIGGRALGEILAVKRYENHTYCHSVNVATLAVMLGERLGLERRALGMLAEGALLHDVGKRTVPVEILRKAGPLNQREWRLVQRHPAYGAELLAAAGGFSSLTPTIALEHHREYGGGGYPDLGDLTPHPLSRIVAVVDTYEALTGARAYREPLVPDEACLILARMAGTKLEPALVRAFVSLITFFPVGSWVRTTRGEVGVVVETNESDTLHPVILVTGEEGSTGRAGDRIDTSIRTSSGAYLRHIVETLPRSGPAPEEEGEADADRRRRADARERPLRPTRWESGEPAAEETSRADEPAPGGVG